MNPLVSIIIPCYNAEAWIAATLESALSQTWPRCEVIVVDDGSTDASVEVVSRFAARGVRLVSQQNKGAAAARNVGIDAASGEFLQFLDADDLLAPDKLERQLERLRAAPLGSVGSCAWARFTNDPAAAEFDPEPTWGDAQPVDWLVNSWSGGGMMQPAVWLTPTAVARAAGPWNEALSLDDDGEYFCRVLLASCGVVHSREARVYYRTHPAGSLSQAKSAKAWKSSHEVCQLVQYATLRMEDSPRVRRACALNHLRFAFHAWPYRSARPLARASLAESRRLDRTVKRPHGGARFELLARILGWKAARTLQVRISLLGR